MDFFLNNKNDEYDFFENIYEFKENECFYNVSVVLEDVTTVEFTFSSIPEVDSTNFISEKIQNNCLPQTIVGYQTVSDDFQNIREIWENRRGEIVHVFPYSVETLVERGYLIEKII